MSQPICLDELELARRIANELGVPVDSIPDAMDLFSELPTPRDISENHATTVRWDMMRLPKHAIVWSYTRTTAIRLAWLSWKLNHLVCLSEEVNKVRPEGWPSVR